MNTRFLWAGMGFLLICCSGDPKPTVATPTDPKVVPPQVVDAAVAAAPTSPEDRLPLVDLGGKESSLGEHRAEVTLLALWASYCEPCLAELTIVEALHQKYLADRRVTVLAINIDDYDEVSVAKLEEIIASRALTVPVFIDRHQQIIDRVGPRDPEGNVHHTVPIIVVVDQQFGIRRFMEFERGPAKQVFVDAVAELVDGALRGDPPPPEPPYQPGLGSSFAKHIVTLTVGVLSEHDIVHYLADLVAMFKEKFPRLTKAQLAAIVADLKEKLRLGGTFKLEIPGG